MRTASALILALLLVTASSAQFGRRQLAEPAVWYALDLLAKPNIHEELKLNADQAKKATELAGSASGLSLSVMRGDITPDASRKQIEKGLAFLKPDQRKRLRELTIQRVLDVPAVTSIMAGDTPLLDELKLTAAQRAKLVPRTKFIDVLTPEQKKALEAMKGNAANPLLLAPRFSNIRSQVRQLPTLLQFLAAPAVEAEIKPTAAQKKKLTALGEKWLVWVPPGFSPNEAQARAAVVLAAEIEKDAKAALTHAQATRLSQIMLQKAKDKARGDHDLLLVPEVADALKLTAKQTERITEILNGRRKGIVPLFTGTASAADILASVGRYHQDTFRMMKDELTAAQKKALDGLFGEPFAGAVEVKQFLPTRAVTPGRRAEELYVYLLARRHANSQELHKELGLTAAQAKQMASLAGGSKVPAGSREQQTTELAREAEAEFAAILKPEQYRRLAEIVYQQFDGRSNLNFSSYKLPQVVEVRLGLGLTPDQLENLGRRGPRGKLIGVLTGPQKEKWKEMQGKATTLKLGKGVGGTWSAPQPAQFALIAPPAVQADLKLTAAQKEKLSAIEEEYRKAALDARRARASTKEAGDKAAEAFEKLLDAAQTKRMEQLRLQRLQQRGLYALLQDKEVVEALKITPAQRTKLGHLELGRLNLGMALRKEIKPTGRGITPISVVRALQSIDEATERKQEDVLDAAQKAKLKEVLGKAFTGAWTSR